MTDCQHCDALVVDWLYDQLEAPLYQRFRAHLSASASCRQQVESLAQTRALIATLPSEEPSPALIQKLIHHAQKQTRSRRARLLTWLSSLAELTWAHPASAALATLVLIAGVAGSLYVSGRATLSAPHGEASRAAESAPATSAAASSAPSAPTEASPEASPEASTTAPAKTPAVDEREQTAHTLRPRRLDRAKANAASIESARTEERNTGARQSDPAANSDGDSANDSPAPVSTPTDNQHLAPGTRAGGRSQGSMLAPPPSEPIARDQTPASRRQRADRGAGQSGTGRYAQPAGSVGGVEAQGVDDADTSGALANSKRPRPSEPSPDRERSSGGSQTQSHEHLDKRSPSAEGKTPSLNAIRARLTRALAANKCRPALALAESVRDRDRDYYRQHLANNRQLTRCQQRVARERTRRAKPSGKANREADERPEREAAQEATKEATEEATKETQ